MIQEKEKFNIQDQADTVAKLAWYSFNQKGVRKLLRKPETEDPNIGNVIFPQDKHGNKRRLVLGIGVESLGLDFSVCILDPKSRLIRVCLDEYTSIELSFKEAYHFELVSTRKIPQLTSK